MVEKKVAYPALTGALGALMAVLVAFNVPLSEDQVVAVLGFAVALGPIVTAFVGWLAPHTERPDLAEYEDPQGYGNYAIEDEPVPTP